MAFMLTSEISKQYLLEEDAVKGFRMAVENGQSRLALQILTDIVDFFMDVISSAIDEEETQDEESAVEQKNEKKTEPELKTQPKIEEKTAEEKTAAKKEIKTAE